MTRGPVHIVHTNLSLSSANILPSPFPVRSGGSGDGNGSSGVLAGGAALTPVAFPKPCLLYTVPEANLPQIVPFECASCSLQDPDWGPHSSLPSLLNHIQSIQALCPQPPLSGFLPHDLHGSILSISQQLLTPWAIPLLLTSPPPPLLGHHAYLLPLLPLWFLSSACPLDVGGLQGSVSSLVLHFLLGRLHSLSQLQCPSTPRYMDACSVIFVFNPLKTKVLLGPCLRGPAPSG